MPPSTRSAQCVDVNTRALARAVRGAGPKQFVEAIALREGDYRRVKDAPRRRARRPRRADRGAAGREPRLRPRAARRRRARHRRAARAARRHARRRRPGRPVGPAGPVREPPRRHRGSRDRDPRERHPGRDALRAPGPPGPRAADHARHRGPAGRRGGARRPQGRGRARGRPAVDRRHPRRRQPPGGLQLRPRARGPLSARLHLQGHHHGGAPARRPAPERDGRLPAHDRRRRPLVQELRGRAPRAPCRSRRTSRSRATPRSSR